MAARFVIKKGSGGTFRFNLVATNGQVVATSEAYKSKASALNGIRAVRSLAADAAVENLTIVPAAARRPTGKAAAAKKPARSGGPAGGACGYYANVGLFGGPPSLRGCGQTIPPGDAASASPSVTLPAAGSSKAVTAADTDGALAQYGPAVLFGGKPPGGPSGVQKVSTKGKTSVTSTASVAKVGPGPFTADAVRSTCTASRWGVKGSTTITRGRLVTGTDADGNPMTTNSVPTKPAVNHTVTGTLAMGDTFKAVFNEQKVGTDGMITVIAAHLYLLGPLAVGDVVIAESRSRV